MIEIVINGETVTLEEGVTLDQVVARFAAASGTVVAVNENFVPRGEYRSYGLKPGDQVELLAPMEGG